METAIDATIYALATAFTGAANNVIHPEPCRARRDALMGPEQTASPTYRRAAVTSSPRNVPLSQQPALHPRVAELQRQESASSLASTTSQSPLLEAGVASASPVSSNKAAGIAQLQTGLLKLGKGQLDRRVSR